MKPYQKYFSVCLLALCTQAAFAQAPNLGEASNFAVLSALTTSPGVVTCTDSNISGDVGTASSDPLSVTRTNCTITGTVSTPVSLGVLTDFNSAYATLADPVKTPCDHTISGAAFSGDLGLPGALIIDGLPNTGPLGPGVYCFGAAATFTSATLTLAGSSTGIWIFKIGTREAGALTGTGFSVIMDGGQACNVYWWVDAAVTMTTSGFQGTILAGAAITATGLANPTTPFNGDALAKAAVTLTNFALTGCQRGTSNPPAPKQPQHSKQPQRCNQGVGNGSENCDPGNSNQSFPFQKSGSSNDEGKGALPGSPGRKGGGK